jgi:hypothetical protein
VERPREPRRYTAHVDKCKRHWVDNASAKGGRSPAVDSAILRIFAGDVGDHEAHDFEAVDGQWHLRSCKGDQVTLVGAVRARHIAR